MLFFIGFLLILPLIWVTNQQSTVFRVKLDPQPVSVINTTTILPSERETTISDFLRYPERLPVYIPIPLLEKSRFSVPEMLKLRGSSHYNPEMGLYTNDSHLHRPYPWVEEPTVWDLIEVVNTVGLDPFHRAMSYDMIDMVAVCTAWEDPPRLYTRIQLRYAKMYQVKPCEFAPWYCMERCEIIQAVSTPIWMTTPKCADPYEGMDLLDGLPKAMAYQYRERN